MREGLTAAASPGEDSGVWWKHRVTSQRASAAVCPMASQIRQACMDKPVVTDPFLITRKWQNLPLSWIKEWANQFLFRVSCRWTLGAQSNILCYNIRPGKSPERSHVSSEPYEPISPPQVPVVHEKQDSMLLLSQRGAEPAEQRWGARCTSSWQLPLMSMCVCVPTAFQFSSKSVPFFSWVTCQNRTLEG